MGGSLLSGDRYFRDLLAATKNGRYFRGVATFGGSLLSELYGTWLGFACLSPRNQSMTQIGSNKEIINASEGMKRNEMPKLLI